MTQNDLQTQYNSILAGMIAVLGKNGGNITLTEADLAINPANWRVGISQDSPKELTLQLIPKDTTDAGPAGQSN